MQELLDFFQKHSSAIQAVSSVIALGIAIFVPYKIDNNTKKRQNELNRIIENNREIALLPLLYDLRFKTLDFLSQNDNEIEIVDIYGEPIKIEDDEFDSVFFTLLPDFNKFLLENILTNDLQGKLTQLIAELFLVQEMFRQNNRLQRHGYHMACQNHLDSFIEKAEKIHKISNEIIGVIELKHNLVNFYEEINLTRKRSIQ